MFAQVSADVRALFSELGIPGDGAEVLVIDRFEQWRNPAGARMDTCIFSYSFDEACVDAA